MDGVTAIANILRMEGVEFIGCVPYQPLLEAAAIAGIRPIIFRQEGTGIHMVDGFSRVTNGKRLGVFMMQNGPGAENGFGGVADHHAAKQPDQHVGELREPLVERRQREFRAGLRPGQFHRERRVRGDRQ